MDGSPARADDRLGLNRRGLLQRAGPAVAAANACATGPGATPLAWAAQQFDIPTGTLAGHRDATPETSRPGANLYGLLAAGPVDLHTICGSEASAAVADMEAGVR